MTKRKKQSLILLTISVPMLWWGFTNFMSDTTSSNALGMMIAISITFGGLAALSGLVMLITKNSLGIWDTDDKEKDRGDGLLASQTKVKDSPVNIDFGGNIINQPTKKVNEMVKTKDTDVVNAVEEIRALGELIVQTEERIKKDTLAVKAATEKRAVLKDNLAKDETVKELLAIITDYQLKQ